MDSALVVLTGRANFKIIVDISDDVDENLAIAKKPAMLVLKNVKIKSISLWFDTTGNVAICYQELPA